jgi:oxygen-dependent protoporphyrinogen oxidase
LSDLDVLVVGGGISGLSTAWLLGRTGTRVEVWEQGPAPGGCIATRVENGYRMERAAAMLLNFRPEVSGFLTEAGLDALKTSPSPAPHRYLIHQDQLTAIPMTLGAMLASPLWSHTGRLRMLLEPLIPRHTGGAETVSEFVTRRLGREVLEKAMDPYIGGTLGSDPDLADARSTLPRLTELERRYGSIAAGILVHRTFKRRTATVTETFSFAGGMGTLVQHLARSGLFGLHACCTALELEPARGGWLVRGQRSGSSVCRRVRHVVLSTPAAAAARLLSPLDTELASLLGHIQYTPLSVVHLGFNRAAIRHRLDGNGFLTPRSSHLGVNGSLWMSSLFPDRAPPGRVLLSNYIGGSRQPRALDWDDERSAKVVLHALTRLLGIQAAPELIRVDRHPQGLPLYYGDYGGRMATIASRMTGLPGLHLEASYRGGVSVRDRIVGASSTATRILADLRRRGELQTANTARGYAAAVAQPAVTR